MAPAITLNRMYHCVPSSISKIDPVFNPPPRLTKPSNSTGNSAVAGTDAAICAKGCAIRARRGLKPMATPAGMVQADAITSAAITRRKVAPALSSVVKSSAARDPSEQQQTLKHAVKNEQKSNDAGENHQSLLPIGRLCLRVLWRGRRAEDK